LVISVPGNSQAGEVDSVYFNWFEIEYPAFFDYRHLSFSVPGEEMRYIIENIPSSNVKVFHPESNSYMDFENIENSQIEFETEWFEGTEFWVVGESDYKSPNSFEVDNYSNLQSPSNNADYILITYKDFLESAESLKTHYQQKAINTKVINVEDIYDEFNFGKLSPDAIKDFLTYAYSNWNSPYSVLLIGDASWNYDYERASGEKNYIPTYPFFAEKHGQNGSDTYFVDTDDDYMPEMYIGRWPVNTPEDAQVLVDKTYNYPYQGGDWREKILFVTWGNSPEDEEYFDSEVESLIANYIIPDYTPLRVYHTPNDPALFIYQGGYEEVLNYWNEGCSFINYSGHASGTSWNVLDISQIGELSNTGMLPFAASMSCFTGDYIGLTGFGEALLVLPDKGVIGFWGSTGIGWKYGNSFLNEELFKVIFIDKKRTMGEITTLALTRFYAAHPSYTDLMRSFTLLGDPLLELAIPREYTADLNGDGKVDYIDLFIFMEQWENKVKK
jgi:hypothetical protein